MEWRKSIAKLLVLILFTGPAVLAQEKKPLQEEQMVEFTKKTHDFGDVLISDGQLSHTFTFTNVSKEPIAVTQVISSCGCTTPVWTREPIMPGKEGKIQVTFANDQGPYPFDKTLTVYITGATATLSRPVILRIRGNAHDRKKSLAELYKVRVGVIGMREERFSAGYIDQGSAKADDTQIANLSKRSVKVTAAGSTPGLTITVFPNPIPPESTAKLTFSIDTKQTGKKLWGRQSFSTGFLLNGKRVEGKVTVDAVIKDDFTHLTAEQIDRAPVPVIDQSYFEFGEIDQGKVVTAEYSIENRGKDPLIIYAVDTKEKGVSVASKLPVTIPRGAAVKMSIRFDSSEHEGEMLEVLALTTNSPQKPIINLFLTGNVIKR